MVFNIPVVRLHPKSEGKFEDRKKYYKFEVASTDCILNAVTYAVLAESNEHKDHTDDARKDVPDHDYLVHNVVKVLDKATGLFGQEKPSGC